VNEIQRELLAGCAILDGERLTTAFGHLSARTQEGILVSGNQGPGLVHGPQDLVTVALGDGSLVAGERGRVPGELPIHLGILARRPEVVSVCRFHGPACLAWATLGRPLPATIGMGLFCGALVPVYDTAKTVTTAAQGAELAEVAGDGDAVLLRGFGAATAGRSVPEAVARAWLLERSAAACLAASAVGEPLAYTPREAAPFAAAQGPAAAQIERLWHYLCRRWPAPSGPPE
jgi:ribulose-5-phosphate 4-epimerase/fuculose-1-phosphate aldolase